jgi:tetratricopeptide (TPR) repeat protein
MRPLLAAPFIVVLLVSTCAPNMATDHVESSPSAEYTDWMPLSAYEDLCAKKTDEEYYPIEAEGTQTLDGPRYRARFERRPAREFYFYHAVGVYEDYFQRRHQELSGQGFRLLWQHQFVDANGKARYQLTWVKDSLTPGEGPRIGLPASPPALERSLSDTLSARGAIAEQEASQLLKEGRYADGLAKAREALALRERVFGPKHVDVAESLTTLAEFHRSMGQYVDAERLHQRALAIREELLSADHAQVAQSLNNLAVLRNAQAMYGEAETMLLRALAILERTQATMQRNYGLQAEVLENLATVYRALGKITEAEESRAKANLFWTLR